MGNWQEKMRQMQEEERHRILAREEEAKIDRQVRQEAQLKSAKDEELRTRAENERKIKIFETLDRLNVRQALEEIKSQVWQNQGTIIEQKTGSNRFVRLSFEFEAAIPETQHKRWNKVVGRHWEKHEYSSGNYVDETVEKNESRVVAWHKVIKPSYLEVGINYPSSIISPGRLADLYVLDTDVDLWAVKEGSSVLGVREIHYTDRKGNRSSKSLPRGESGPSGIFWSGPTTYTSYSLDDHKIASITSLGLPSDMNEGLTNEFLNSCFAVSSALRKSQGKLPSQLK